MTCLRIGACALVLSLALQGRSPAEIITVEFSGHVTFDPNAIVPLGTVVTGLAAYDSCTTTTSTGSVVTYFGAVESFEFSIVGNTYLDDMDASDGVVSVWNDFPPFAGGTELIDRFSIGAGGSHGDWSGPPTNGLDPVSMFIQLDDLDEAVFSSTAIPTEINLNDFESREFLILWSDGINPSLRIDGVLDEFSVVPEPTTLAALASLGIAGLCFSRRRRR